MMIDIRLTTCCTRQGNIVSVDADVMITHSPREGFDNEKLGALEKELSALVGKRLTDAIKNRGGAA